MAALGKCVRLLAPSFCRISAKTTTPSLSKRFICDSQLRGRMSKRLFSSAKPLQKKETVMLHFVLSDGEKLSTKANVGDNLLDVVIENDLDIDGFGACEGTLACSTCHLVFKQEHFDQLPDKPTDEELDMLDLAYGLCDTSRLGCQVIVSKDMDGWVVQVPAGVADAREP